MSSASQPEAIKPDADLPPFDMAQAWHGVISGEGYASGYYDIALPADEPGPDRRLRPYWLKTCPTGVIVLRRDEAGRRDHPHRLLDQALNYPGDQSGIDDTDAATPEGVFWEDFEDAEKNAKAAGLPMPQRFVVLHDKFKAACNAFRLETVTRMNEYVAGRLPNGPLWAWLPDPRSWPPNSDNMNRLFSRPLDPNHKSLQKGDEVAVARIAGTLAVKNDKGIFVTQTVLRGRNDELGVYDRPAALYEHTELAV